MTINVKNNNLIITFKYDAKIVTALRLIPGRRYNVNKKHWEVPVENAVCCIDALQKLGLTPTLEAKTIYKQQLEFTKQAETLKVSPEKYTGALPLFDFQKIGASFLKSMPNALLADQPGLGKTIQTIAALEDLPSVPFLILCPASLKYSWAEELRKWNNNDVQVINGNKTERDQQWKKLKRWNIANYELLLRDFETIPKDWEVIVCDEATRISNPAAKTTKLLKQLNAKKKIALTGTPISNAPIDIFSIIDWIAPRYLGSYYQFLERHCVREPRFNRIIGYKNLEELSWRIGTYMLRRTKEEVLKDLPPKIIKSVSFQLTKEEKKLYEGVRKQIAEEIKYLTINPQSLNLIPVKMLRLKQVTNHPALITGQDLHESSKLNVLKDLLLPIIQSGEKAIIFTQFAQMAKILLNYLNIYQPRLIIGEIDAESRQRAVQEFTDDPDCKVIIMSEAGTYGLNLQAASYIFMYDLPWSVAKLQQREDRAHRIGQTKSVIVYNLIAQNTIDEYVAKILHKKQKISVDILKDADRLEEMGLAEEDIKNILRI